MVLNEYIIKDVYVDKFKDVITSYYNGNIENLDILSVYVYWKVIDEIIYKISVPNMIAYGQTVYSIPINIFETAFEFLDKVIKGYLNGIAIDKIEEVEKVFISDLNDLTYTHYMEQPKSMICRKMKRRFFDVKSEYINDFEYNWIPVCLCVNGLYEQLV